MILKFNNTDPQVKFKVDELEDGLYCTVMPLYKDGSVAFIGYEGPSFYEAWTRFLELIENENVYVPKQFEKYLG